MQQLVPREIHCEDQRSLAAERGIMDPGLHFKDFVQSFIFKFVFYFKSSNLSDLKRSEASSPSSKCEKRKSSLLTVGWRRC